MRSSRRTLTCREPLDVGLTYGPLARGPAARLAGDEWWRAMNTPAGPACLHLGVDRTRRSVAIEAWGAGRDWVVDRAADITGESQLPIELTNANATVSTLRHRLRGLRLTRLGCALDVAVATILGQRVTTVEAQRSWRGLVWKHGTPAPGPCRLRVPPSEHVLRTLPDWEWRALGVELGRSATIRAIAHEASRVDHAADEGSVALDHRLRTVRGVGPWTSATVVHYVAADADAVPVGDWHLPGHVGYALAGEPRADDARMLELLEAFRPHRALVWRLVVAGAPAPPRRAPRARIIGLLHAEARRGRPH